MYINANKWKFKYLPQISIKKLNLKKLLLCTYLILCLDWNDVFFRMIVKGILASLCEPAQSVTYVSYLAKFKAQNTWVKGDLLVHDLWPYLGSNKKASHLPWILKVKQ